MFQPTRFSLLVVIALALVGTSEALAYAPKKGKTNSAQEKKDDAKVKQQTEEAQRVQKQLQDEMKNLNDAERKLAQAQAKLKSEGNEERSTRERVEQTQGRSLGIDKSLEQQSAAKKAYEEASEPILKTLKESAAYKSAKVRSEKGHEELKKIRSMEGLSFDDRKRMEAAATANALAMANVEKEALQADPKVMSLKEKYDDAAERVAQLRGRIKQMVDSDSAVKTAHQSTNKARESVEAEERHVAQLRQKVAATRAKLARETQDVAQAKAADKANDNKNNGKKK